MTDEALQASPKEFTAVFVCAMAHRAGATNAQVNRPCPPRTVINLHAAPITELVRLPVNWQSGCAAGRFDLHHAIKYNGGYQEVGQALGRGSAWPRHTELLDARTLAAELRAFQREQGADAGCMPSARALIDADRQELLQARRSLIRWLGP